MEMFHLIKKISTRKLAAVSTVEVLLAMSIFMLYGTFLVGSLIFSVQSTKYPSIRDTAVRYAEEGLEISRFIRRNDITNLANGTYGLQQQVNDWSLVTAPEVLSPNYSRSITISSPSVNTRLVTSTVTWSDGGRTGSESLSTIYSNWAGLSISPWASPTLLATFNAAGNYDMSQLYVNGSTLYALRRNSSTQGYVSTFNIVSLPTITQIQQLAIAADASDAVFTPTRFYISSTANSTELVGVNVPSPSTMSLYGTSNLPGNTDAQGIARIGTTLYVTQGSAFRRFSDNGSGTFTNTNTYTLSGVFYDIANKDSTYAYASHSTTTGEVRVLNISNLAVAPTLAGTINTPSATTGKIRLGFLGNYLLVFSYQNGIYIYDTTLNATSPAYIGNVSVGTNRLINDFYIDTARNLVFVATTDPNAEIQVFDFTTPTAVTTRGTYNMPVAALSLYLDEGNDRLFVGSSDNNVELTVLEAK